MTWKYPACTSQHDSHSARRSSGIADSVRTSNPACRYSAITSSARWGSAMKRRSQPSGGVGGRIDAPRGEAAQPALTQERGPEGRRELYQVPGEDVDARAKGVLEHANHALEAEDAADHRVGGLHPHALHELDGTIHQGHDGAVHDVGRRRALGEL